MSARAEHSGRIGPYKIEAVLGRGGMGTVYRAVKDDAGPPVALKVLLPDLSRDIEYLKRFRREIKAASQLTSHHVVHIIEWGEDNGTFFFAMELLEDGRDLARIIKEEGPQPPERVINLAIQLCDALSELHGTGVVHRDIKPGNLMLLPDGTMKLMDFGLAKMVDRTSLTATGEALGSPRYMSPEILQGKPADYRSDVYQVGTLLYELLAARPAFDGSSFDHLLHLILETEPEPLSELRPELDSGLCLLVATCMRKKSSERYRTIKDLERNLRALREGRGLVQPEINQSTVLRTTGVSTSATAPPDDCESPDAGSGYALQRLLWYGLFALPFVLLTVIVLRRAPPPVDPCLKITRGFGSALLEWKTARSGPTSVRYRYGDGPIRKLVNAAERRTRKHSIVLHKLESGKEYKLRLAGVRGRFRRSYILRLDRVKGPEKVEISRTPGALSLLARFPFPVKSRLLVVARGKEFRSQKTADGPARAIACKVEGIDEGMPIDRMSLVLTDIFGQSRSFDLSATSGSLTSQTSTNSHGSAAPQTSASLPGSASPQDSTVPSAPSPSFSPFTADFEKKLAVYRKALAEGAPESTYTDIVSWRPRGPGDMVLPKQTVFGPELPYRLESVTRSDAANTRGIAFEFTVYGLTKGGKGELRLRRGELPPGTVLRILLNDAFEIHDRSGLRGEGEWVIDFAGEILHKGRNSLCFLLVGTGKTTEFVWLESLEFTVK